MKNNKKKILVYSILGIITVLIVTLTITYAYWILTRQQTGENVVNTACLNISFTGENDITLDKAYPMQPAELEKFLSTETPYHFTIHNECSELASATINLESLNAEGEKQLEDQYINVILYETDYHTNLNSEKKLIERIYNDENKVINNSLHAYSLYNFNLKPDETRDFNLLLYMDPDTPMESANMNASWKGKITLSTEYQEDSRALRTISSTDNKGMWGYKDKLTKIVIEDTKNVKTAPEGGKVYGPFDESEYGTKAVESYVVCEADDINCVGYLQSDGKVIANSNSSNLFYYFNKITFIENLENIDTSQVIDMRNMFSFTGNFKADFNKLNTSKVENLSGMFSYSKIESIDLSGLDVKKVTSLQNMFSSCTNLTNVNLSHWDTSSVNSIDYMFNGATALMELNISNWIFNDNMSNGFSQRTYINPTSLILNDVDTSKVTDMVAMFSGLSRLKSLDLSSFDTSHVTNMTQMFAGDSNLQTLNISNFVTTSVINMFQMFTGASALQSLDLSGWNTSNVTNMSSMFASLTNLQELDLSSFDTSQVTDMSSMFAGTFNLQTITFGPNFVHKEGATTEMMFGGCPAPDRPTGDTWSGVSYD